MVTKQQLHILMIGLKKKKQFHQMSKHKRARCLHMTDKPVNEDDVQYSQIYS